MIIIENKWQEEEGRRDLEDYFPEILLPFLIERSSDQIGCREFHREPKRETLAGMQSVGSCTLDRIRGWDLKKRKKEKKRRSSLGLDETQSTEVFNDRRSWSAKYGTVGEDRADRVTSGPRCKGRALPG